MITCSTTIEELLQKGYFSQRAYNICFYKGLLTVLDLFNFRKSNDFINLRNCGKKTVFEINNVISIARVDETVKSVEKKSNVFQLKDVSKTNQTILQNSYLLITNNGVTSGNNLLLNVFPAQESFIDFLVGENNINVIEVANSVGANVLDVIYAVQTIRRQISYIAKNFKKNVSNDLTFIESFEARKEQFMSELPSLYTKVIIEFSSEESARQISEDYKKCINNAGVRGSRFLYDFLPTFCQGIDYIDRPIEDLYELCIGRKLTRTIEGAKSALDNFSQRFHTLIDYDQVEFKDHELANSFPFLYKGQRDFIKVFKEENGYYPGLFVIYQYLASSNEVIDSIAYDLIGGGNAAPLSIDEIAVKRNKSRERIRQLTRKIRSSILDQNFIEELDLSVYPYDGSLCMPIYESDISVIIKKERLNMSTESFIRLVTMFFSIAEYEYGQKHYFVQAEFKPHISKLINQVERQLLGAYTEDTTINVFSKCEISPEICKNADFKSVVVFLLKDIFGVYVSNSGNHTIKKNKFSIRQAIYEILKENEKPTRLEDLRLQFNERYPESSIDASSTFRNFVLSDSRIQAIGKTSTYALAEWPNIFWGSIRDLLYEILDESSVPLHIDVIVDRVLAIFPDTNKKSISSTMMSDEMDRFVAFYGSYFGVLGKEYDERFVLLPVVQRAKFEIRLNDLDTFISTFNRFPFSNGGVMECSLNRWYSRVINGSTIITNEQKILFETVLSKYKDLPHNYDEFVINKRCKEYKQFVDDNYQMPAIKGKGKALHTWFEKTHKNYFSLSQLSKRYYKILCQYLIDMGFVEKEEVLFDENYNIPIQNEYRLVMDKCQNDTVCEEDVKLPLYEKRILLADYERQFTSLNVASINGVLAPHKSILLMSIINMIERGNIKTPIIPYDESLNNEFIDVWKHYVSRKEFDCALWMPFYHMKSEPFWSLVSSSEEDANRVQISSAKRLRELILGSIISEDLFELLQTKSNRDELRKVLVDKYLTEK